MHILMLGLDHRSAPVEVRERATMSASSLPEYLAHLLQRPEVLEAVILSTCNRTEIYATVEDFASGYRAITEFLAAKTTLPREALQAHVEQLHDERAVLHLFRVASGLESLVLGEGQILHQVKDAHAAALEHGAAGMVLDRLFRSAVTAGKRSRTETDIARGAVSVSSAAVELARQTLGDLAGKSILLLGSGKMSELAAKLLSDQGISDIVVANRTRESAESLARIVGGRTVPWVDLTTTLLGVDVVLCCTGAPHYVLAVDDVRDRLGERSVERPLVLIDISVPRNLEPALGQLPGVELFDIDDLHSVADSNRHERASVVGQVEAILEGEVTEFEAWIKNLRLTPMLTSLRTRVESLREIELERFWHKHAHDFSDQQQLLVEEMARALVNKILHQPTAELKRMSPPQQHRHASALKALFGLSYEDAASHYRRQLGERRRRLTLSR